MSSRGCATSERVRLSRGGDALWPIQIAPMLLFVRSALNISEVAHSSRLPKSKTGSSHLCLPDCGQLCGAPRAGPCCAGAGGGGARHAAAEKAFGTDSFPTVPDVCKAMSDAGLFGRLPARVPCSTRSCVRRRSDGSFDGPDNTHQARRLREEKGQSCAWKAVHRGHHQGSRA